jgi:hypothetical protein
MLSTLMARYDAQLLRPPAPPARPVPSAVPAGLPPLERDVQQQLLAWCRQGAGDGRSAIPLPLGIALLTGVPDTGACALVEDTALQLDGSHALLAAGGRWRQRLFRLRVKWDECRRWRPRAADAPWDSGYLLDSADTLARLAHFQPRRPTLIVAQGLADATLRQVLQVLDARRAAWRQPVRLLVVAPSPPTALAGLSADAGSRAERGALSFRVLPPRGG